MEDKASITSVNIPTAVVKVHAMKQVRNNMADIELVIKIPKEKYNYVKKQVADGITNPLKICIANGTPLPKGHGRLIDESKITKCEQIGLVIKDDSVTRCLITDAPTIIEADKAESEE